MSCRVVSCRVVSCRVVSVFGIFMIEFGNKIGYIFLMCNIDGFQNCINKGCGRNIQVNRDWLIYNKISYMYMQHMKFYYTLERSRRKQITHILTSNCVYAYVELQ